MQEMIGATLFAIVDPERGFIEVNNQDSEISSCLNMLTLTFRDKSFNAELYIL